MRDHDIPVCRCGTEMPIEAESDSSVVYGCPRCYDVRAFYK